MRIFVVADVHANLAALEAVAKMIPDEAPDLVLCLGDTVGYNAQPSETLALVRELSDVVIEGNHDRDSNDGVAHPTTGRSARVAIEYTRDALSESERSYLKQLPHIHRQAEFVAVHGCYLNEGHVTGYITSTMLERNLDRVAERDQWASLAFCGHTHVPMVGYRVHHDLHEPTAVGEIDWPRGADAVLINPGSVGQPRDQDSRAAYCVVDTQARTVRFERVTYDLEQTIAANQQAGLPEDLSQRLREGR